MPKMRMPASRPYQTAHRTGSFSVATRSRMEPVGHLAVLHHQQEGDEEQG